MAPRNIELDGSADYKAAVDVVLTEVGRNEVGSVILSEIADQKRTVTLLEYHKGKEAVHGHHNALASAKDVRAGAPAGVSGAGPGYWYAGKSDDPRTFKDERYTLMPPRVAGTGKGSAADIHFSPERHARATRPHERPDTVLLHELVHALRYTQGLANPVPTKEPVWDNEEEYLAVVVTNVYQSVKGARPLRRGHGHQSLAAPLDTSAGFLDFEMDVDGTATRTNWEVMSIHERIWPTFWEIALHVKTAPFNPFRELLSRNVHLHVKTR